MLDGVGAPRAPALGAGGGRARVAGLRRGLAARGGRRGRSAGTRRGRRARASRRTRRSTGRCPGSASSRSRIASRSAPGSSTSVAVGASAAASAAQRAPARARGIGSASSGRPRRARRRWGSACGEAPSGLARSGSRERSGSGWRASRPASVRAPATETCWPSTARTASSAPSTVPGTRTAGRGGRRAARAAGRRASASSTATGSASRSSSRRQRCDRGGEVAQVGRARSVAVDVVVGRRGREPGRPRAVRQAQHAPVGAVGPRPTPPRPAPRAWPRKSSSAGARRAARGRRRRSGDRAAAGAAAAGDARASRSSRRACVANTSRTVSLNWRMLGEAGRERDLGERQVGGLDQQPRGLGPLRPGERERAGAELGDELPVEVALAVAEPAREAGDALAVDDAVARSAASPGRRGRRATFHSGEPGAASGRQRLQARKPARCAAAAVGRKRTFARFGVIAGQLGRQ